MNRFAVLLPDDEEDVHEDVHASSSFTCSALIASVSPDPEEGSGSPSPFTPPLNHPCSDRPLMKDRREREDRQREREMECAGGSPEAAGERATD